MATITTRSGKGSPLTNDEVDSNFTNLNNDKAELSGADFTGDVGVTGNISVTGTVDGRDVAADGTKLDGIESNATADQTAAEIRALVDSATDSNVFTDADHTKLDGIEALADVTDTTNVVAALTAGTNITIAADGTISSTDTNTQLTAEQVQDIVGAMFSGNTETRITATYQDIDGTIDLVVDNMNQTVGDATITISAGTDLTGGGVFTTNQGTAGTITINHEDVSSQASVNNSGGTVIQDVTLNANGHVTALGSVDLDSRYFTETEADARFLRLTGGGMSGDIDMNANDITEIRSLVLQNTEGSDHGTVSGTLMFDENFHSDTEYGTAWSGGNGGGIAIYNEDGWGRVLTDRNAQWHTATFDGLNIGSNSVFHDGYHPNADKWTTARTISLSGDLSGSVSLDGSANVTLSAQVSDDSHNHVFDNIDITLLSNTTNLNDLNTPHLYQWGSSQPTNSPDDYTYMMVVEDGGQPQQWAFSYGGATNTVKLFGRRKTSGTWDTSWTEFFSDHYHPNADKWTTARTLSLTGDVTGSASVDGSANASISATLATPTEAPASWQDVVAWNGGLIKDAAVEIHGSGYLRATYLNMTHGVGTRSSDTVFYSSNDDFIRKTDATGMRSSLNVPTRTGGDASGTWGISITGDAGTLDGLDSTAFIRANADDNVFGHTEWQDNYQVRFGNGADFRIFHDGNHTYLRNYNHAQGNIYFTGEDTAGVNKALIYMINNTARPYVRLFEDGGERLKTTSTGVDLTLGMSVAGTTVIDSSRNVTNLGTVGCGSLTSTGSLSSDGSVNVGDGTAQSKITIKKADNNTSDHIEFYNGTVRIGEIGCEDNTWLRINQETNSNIYTPRYIRADNGFRVDGTALGIQGDGASVIPVGSAATPSLRFNGDTNTGVYQNGADAVGISAGGTPRASFGSTIYLQSDDVRINRYLYHNGDTNTYMRMDADRIAFVAGAVEFIDMTEGADDNIDFNTRARFNKGIREQSDTLTGTAVTINQNNATNFVHDLTGNTTYTFSNPAASGDSSSFTLKVIQDTTARTITWPTSVDWVGGSAPTLSSASGAVDVFVFFTHDGGTTYYGFVAGQDLK